MATWGGQVEDSSMRMAVSGCHHHDGNVRAVVSWWWCSIFTELVFQFWTDVIFELSSFTVQYKRRLLLPRYAPLPYIGKGKVVFLCGFLVDIWLQYSTIYITEQLWWCQLRLFSFAIMLVLWVLCVQYTPIYTTQQYGLFVCCLWFLWGFCHHAGFVVLLAL